MQQECDRGLGKGFCCSLYCTHAIAEYCVQVRVKLGSSILDSYSRWIPPMGRTTADGMDEALG